MSCQCQDAHTAEHKPSFQRVAISLLHVQPSVATYLFVLPYKPGQSQTISHRLIVQRFGFPSDVRDAFDMR
jgi:hypothetical protein